MTYQNGYREVKDNRKDRVRVNEGIRISPIRVIKEGQQLGVMPTYQARRLAEEAGLDLVEVAPHERPPVCRIMDYGKYKYEQSIKEKGRKQKSKDAEIKELRLRPKIGDNDILVKVNSARKFLEQGKKVQFNLIYKNRELAHKDEGFKVVDKVIEQLKDVGKIEIKPTLQGTKLFCRFEPTKE